MYVSDTGDSHTVSDEMSITIGQRQITYQIVTNSCCVRAEQTIHSD